MDVNTSISAQTTADLVVSDNKIHIPFILHEQFAKVVSTNKEPICKIGVHI